MQVSRRTFLRSLAGAAAGVAVGGLIPTATKAAEPSEHQAVLVWADAIFESNAKYRAACDRAIARLTEPPYIGRSFVLEDTTMYVKRESYMLEFFAYETVGTSVDMLSTRGVVS